MIGVAPDHLARKAWASDRANAQTIVPLIGRTLRVGLALVALLVAISQFGYPVGTLLAGLGLGGHRGSSSGTEDRRNLFGSVTLGGRPGLPRRRLGEVRGGRGAVERIGLRSTHVRTMDRTLGRC